MPESIKFYDVKHKRSVMVPASQVRILPGKSKAPGVVMYAAEVNGVKLRRFGKAK
jgi:hypothetical protein